MQSLVRTRRPWNRKRGAAVVEFAVVAPVLVLFLFGVIEYGRVFQVRQAIQHATREGARTAVLQSTDEDTYMDQDGPVAQRIASVLDSVGITFSSNMLSVQTDTPEDGMVTIIVTVPYTSVTEILGSVVPSQLVGSTTMRKEG